MPTRFRRTAASLLVGAAALLGPVAAASASDATIRSTITHAAPAIQKTQAKVVDGLSTLEKTNSSTALVKAAKAQNRSLTSLKNKLGKVSSSTSRGSKGKADIIRGLKLIIHSNRTLTKDLQKRAAGKPYSKTQVNAAIATDKRGNTAIVAGSKLLS